MKNKSKTLKHFGVTLAAILLFASGLGLGSFLALNNMTVSIVGRCMFTLPDSFQVPDRN